MLTNVILYKTCHVDSLKTFCYSQHRMLLVWPDATWRFMQSSISKSISAPKYQTRSSKVQQLCRYGPTFLFITSFGAGHVWSTFNWTSCTQRKVDLSGSFGRIEDLLLLVSQFLLVCTFPLLHQPNQQVGLPDCSHDVPGCTSWCHWLKRVVMWGREQWLSPRDLMCRWPAESVSDQITRQQNNQITEGPLSHPSLPLQPPFTLFSPTFDYFVHWFLV